MGPSVPCPVDSPWAWVGDLQPKCQASPPKHPPPGSCFRKSSVIDMTTPICSFKDRTDDLLALCGKAQPTLAGRKIPEAGYPVQRSLTNRLGYQGWGYGVGQVKPGGQEGARLYERPLTQGPRLDPQSCPPSLPPSRGLAHRSEPAFPGPSATSLGCPAAVSPPPPGFLPALQAQGA